MKKDNECDNRKNMQVQINFIIIKNVYFNI